MYNKISQTVNLACVFAIKISQTVNLACGFAIKNFIMFI